MVPFVRKMEMIMEREIDPLSDDELAGVAGGFAPATGVVCKYPAEPEQTCGTKGPGPHVPVLS
jgi:hypothetical protein